MRLHYMVINLTIIMLTFFGSEFGSTMTNCAPHNLFVVFQFIGYATSIIVEYIQEKCKDRGSLRNQFHLFAGTSVGGAASLLLSKNKTM